MLVHKSLCEWERGNQKPNSKNDEEKTWKRKFERYRPSLELGYYLFDLDFFFDFFELVGENEGDMDNMLKKCIWMLIDFDFD